MPKEETSIIESTAIEETDFSKGGPKRSTKFPDEIVAQAKNLFIFEKQSIKDISKALDVPISTVNRWVVKLRWGRERQKVKGLVEKNIYDDRLGFLVERKKKAAEAYDFVQRKTLEELKRTDISGAPSLKFRDASSAISSLDTAIRGEFSLSEETIPLRVMEFISELFIESIDEIMIEDKSFRADIAQRLSERFIGKVRSFGQFWISGGKTARNFFGSNQ